MLHYTVGKHISLDLNLNDNKQYAFLFFSLQSTRVKKLYMKNTLEYKILKYLSKNDNGKYLNIEHLENNKNLLKNKIDNLLQLGYISEKLVPTFSLEYKIEYSGIEYLNNLKSKPMTRFEKYSLYLIIIPIIINLFQWSENNSLIKQRDSSKLELDACTKNVDSLINTFDLKKVKAQE